MESGERVGGMAAGDVAGLGDALREIGVEAREAAARFAESIELERRMEETPLVVLGVAAAVGLVLGGGLWPLLRPFVRAAARTALSPANLLALGAAVGAMRAASAREPAPVQTSTASH